MVSIHPFHAAYYNPEKIRSLAEVITQPYDQISEESQQQLMERHPWNFVRLILGKTSPDDSPGSNRYTRAAAELSEWLDKKILIKEEKPVLFIYEQNFSMPNGQSYARTGVIGLVRLEPLGKNILPHEKTFPKPKADRLQLMQACRANFEHVFFLADDRENQLRQMLSQACKEEPFLSCRDDSGVVHSLWKISGENRIQEIQSFFSSRPLLIADGHHRYETSLAYEKEQEEKNPNPNASFHFRLGTIVPLQDPGLTILPTHRVLKFLSPEEKERLDQQLKEIFSIRPVSNLQEFFRESAERQKSLGFYRQNQFQILQWKKSSEIAKALSGVSPLLQNLDVFRLHHLVFERILHIPEEKWMERIAYVRRPEEAIRMAKNDPNAAVFLLNPATPAEILAIAAAGATMPHKSTDFYPKLASGLVFYIMK